MILWSVINIELIKNIINNIFWFLENNGINNSIGVMCNLDYVLE